MATLKDHQQAMVDLLASGSGIPASSSRLAHAMHDVLSAMLGDKKESFAEEMTRLCNERIEATTPGLNDKALAADVEVCRPKATPAERRVKELQNTINQLRASNVKLRKDNEWLKCRLSARDDAPEQSGCRKPDTQICVQVSDHDFAVDTGFCVYCGKHYREVTK
ncbi:hypothetical protein EHH83_16675 [Salmonella enterica]|nr:hypothetical protein [Salmonella enterica]